MALLATLNALAYTRIVKHYHYHFATYSFPASSRNDCFSVLNEFMAKNSSSLSYQELKMLKRMRRDALLEDYDLSILTSPYVIAEYANDSSFNCKELYALVVKFAKVYDVDYEQSECVTARENLKLYSFRRLRTHVKLEKGG